MRLFFYRIVLIFFVGLLLPTPSHSMQLGDRLKGGQPGDYIVTEQDKMYTVLLLRSIDTKRICLEEISAASSTLPKKTNWKEWVQKGAPGHTSWIMYEIDTLHLHLLEAYSFTKRGWLAIDDEEDFLGKLLKVQLEKIPYTERKKTGPQPLYGEPDLRKIWNPSISIEGQKQKTSCDVFKGFWPKDKTILSGCSITLYFPTEGPSFFFPYWIEASNGHYTHMIHTIDLGRNMVSAIQNNLPHRPPKISSIHIDNEHVRLCIVSPPYYEGFKVFVFDITKPFEHIGPLPFTLIPSEKKKEIWLQSSCKNLQAYLQEGHRYKWILLPDESSIFYVESEDIYLWKGDRKK